MMFTTAGAVENSVFCLLLADQPRATNRALVNSLFNGSPPYTEEEIQVNKGATNVNDLSATKINMDARGQFDNAFLVPDPLFSIALDYGPAWKRLEWGGIITKEINKRIKNCAAFGDMQQSVFANVVLHGPGPSMWEDDQKWLQTPLGVEDVLVPGNTLRSCTNLEQFAIYRRYSGAKLWRMTHGPQVDPAWNMPLVEECLAWVDKQAQTLNGNTFPDVWFPEKMQERWKSDAGIYSGDISPTINCWDFYFWNDNGEQSGWNRRIILDAWGQPGIGGNTITPDRKIQHGKGKFLYDGGERVYASKLDEIIHFQSGDASPVAPFLYHSQRSLGFLLYAVCHLQNRLFCKFNDSVFESMLQYFRVNNPADMDRLTKIDLIDKGLLPEGMAFVRPEERWKVDQALVSEAFSLNRQKMNDMSASFSQDADLQGQQEETATRTMAKVNSTAALIGAILNRAYIRERFRYMEICRRFCIPSSKDMDVMQARNAILRAGVPEEALDSERWNVQPTKVIGQGNNILGAAIADKLMAIRPQLNPEAQHEVDRIYIATNSGNWDLADKLVPDSPHVSDSVHDAEMSFGTLMQGVEMKYRPGLNDFEVAETIISLMSQKIQEIETTDNVGTPADLKGLATAAGYANAFIGQLAQNPAEKSNVKALGDELGLLGNKVKAFGQRQMQAMQQAQQQNGNGQMTPEDQAKIQATIQTAQTKSEIQQKNAAAKTAQSQIRFEQKVRQDAIKNAQQLEHDAAQHQAELSKTALETAHALSLQKLQAENAPEPKESA